MKNELISVIMPVYNTEKYIGKSIESILNQTYENFELIIVDDSSTDNSYEIAKKYQEQDKRIKLLKNKFKKGISGGVNTGISIAKGRYLTRMDSDDISLPTRLEKQIEFLENNKEYNACSVNIYYIDKNGKKISNPLYFEQECPAEWKIIVTNPVPNAPILYDLNIIKKSKIQLDDKYKSAEDYDFLSRYILNGGKVAFINETLYEYRTNINGTSSTNFELTMDNSKEIMATFIKKISNKNIPKDYYLYTDFKKGYMNLNQELNIKEIVMFYKDILEDFNKYFKWSKEDYKKCEKYIDTIIEKTVLAKYTRENLTILQRIFRIIKRDGITGLLKKIKNVLFNNN